MGTDWTLGSPMDTELESVCALLATFTLPTHGVADLLEHFTVARSGMGIAGVVGLEPRGNAALLRSLCVTPALHGRGLGAALCNAAQQYAISLGLSDLYLLTNGAQGFFATHGFAEVDRNVAPSGIRTTAEFQSLCPATATCMHKVLRRPGVPSGIE